MEGEKKRTLDFFFLALKISDSIPNAFSMFFCIFKILSLKQKLKAYELKNSLPSASNMISSQNQAEFKR